MTIYPWPNGTSVNFSFAQAFSSNWFWGEENFFAVKLNIRSRDERKAGPFVFRNYLTVGIGANYQDDSIPENMVRVGENDLFGELLIAYPVSWRVDPYIAASLRTSITESFQYYGPSRMRVASLWDPVTSRQSTGLQYMLVGGQNMFNTRVGVAIQQIRAKYNTMLTDDYTTFDVKEAYRPQSGIEFVNDATLRGDSTLTYEGKLTLFGSFEDLSVWTVEWKNETRFRLWKSIGLTWTFNVLHDIRQTRRTQFKHSVMLGLNQDF